MTPEEVEGWLSEKAASQLTVIFDIDDVLLPWAQKVHEACVEAGLTKLENLWSSWHMWEDYGCTKEQWLHVVDSLVVPGGVYHGAPYPGAVEAMWELRTQGHAIHLVTARGFFAHSQQIRNWTREWINTNNIPGQLWFAQDKGRIAKEVKATHAIDDRMENVLELRDAGVDAYLMNQPHNAKLQYPDGRRVDSVAEFVERILNG